MKNGDKVDTPWGPGVLIEIRWTTHWAFGRPRHDAWMLVELPGGRHRIFHSGQVWPLRPQFACGPDDIDESGGLADG